MIKLLFFTDLHIAKLGPKSRVDDYLDSICAKLDEALELGTKCDFILFGGDFCHSHFLSSDKVKEQAIETMAKHLVPSKTPLLYTWGQHDLFGKEYSSRTNSTAGFIFRLVKKLGADLREIPVEETMQVNDDFLITACPSGYDPEQWLEDIQASHGTEIRNHTSVAILHHLVHTEIKTPWFIDPDNLNTEGIDLVLCGDLHDGFPKKCNKYGTLFVNPGSMARTQHTKSERDRKIQVLELKIDKGKIEAKYKKLKSAKTGSKVFNKKAPLLDSEELYAYQGENISASEDKDGRIGLDEFLTSLDSFESENVDLWELLMKRANEEQLDESVYDYLLEKRSVQ